MIPISDKMKSFSFTVFYCLACAWLATPGLRAQTPEVTFPDDSVDPLATLKTTHPRLIASTEDLAALNKITDDPLRAEVNKCILATAETTLKAPLIRYKIAGANYLLFGSRGAFQHIVLCAMAYRLTHDARFADRARQEMLNVAAFPDWSPKHFLDVSEMATAVAIGYDWCYDALSPQDRATIKQALMDKALVFAPAMYGNHITDHHLLDPRFGFVMSPYNWNPVCNGGMLAAALAVADEEPATARQVIQGVRAYLPIALHTYAPDGAWPEGPAYLTYGTSYSVLALSMLKSALGTDFGLSQVEPAFSKVALFRLKMHPPDGLLYNFADAEADDEARTGVNPAFGWLAGRFGPPIAAAQFRESLRKEFADRPEDKETPQFFALHALWLPAEPTDASAGAPLDAHYRGEADVAVFRSAWDDPDALYLGFKNGHNNKTDHGHLDLGSFFLEADGVRWSAQLGKDDYNLPKYFRELRWTYFRLNNYSQSTIIPGHLLQAPQAVAPIFDFHSAPDQGSAVADLTAAYPGAAQKMIRGVFFQNRARVLVQDDVTGLAPNTTLNWQMVTPAKIDLSKDGRTATLTSAGKTLRVEMISPSNAQFSIASAVPPNPAKNQNAGYSILLGTVPAQAAATDVRLAVLLTPVGPKWPLNQPAPQIEALPTPAASP
jgi:hypothetical protein